MSKYDVITKNATALLLIGLIVGASGSYLITIPPLRKTIDEKGKQIEDLTIQIGSLNSEITTLENEVATCQTNISRLMEEKSELETHVADLETLVPELETRIEMLEYRIWELEETVEALEHFIHQIETMRYTIANRTTFYVEDFDTTEIGGLPEGWLQIQGTHMDVAAVMDDESHSSPNSLKVHEEGGDGDNCKVSLTGLEINESFALEMMFQVRGSPADRGVFHFLNEDDEECISINCLIDFRWGNREKGFDLGWETLENDSWREFTYLPAPESGVWYNVTITGWREEQKVRLTVDDVNSEWMSVQREWSTITAVSFRGNYNYAGDSWYDNIKISTISVKDDSVT